MFVNDCVQQQQQQQQQREGALDALRQ